MEIENSFTGESFSGETVLTCPECGSEMRLLDTRKGRFYGCIRYPECRTTHGCHPDGAPLGVPADKETREARIEAHYWFDALWRSGQYTRGAAYRRLQSFLNMEREECHIGKFSKSQCERVVIFAKGACQIYGINPDDFKQEQQ